MTLPRDRWQKVELLSEGDIPLIPVFEGSAIKLLDTVSGDTLEAPVFGIAGHNVIPTGTLFRRVNGIQHDGITNRTYLVGSYDASGVVAGVSLGVVFWEIEIEADRIELAAETPDESIAQLIEPRNLTRAQELNWFTFVYDDDFYFWPTGDDDAMYWSRGDDTSDPPAGTLDMSFINATRAHRSRDFIYDFDPPMGIYNLDGSPVATGIGSGWNEVQVAHDPQSLGIWAVVHDDQMLREYSAEGELLDEIPIRNFSSTGNEGNSYVLHRRSGPAASMFVRLDDTLLLPEEVINTDSGQAIQPQLLEHEITLLNPSDSFLETSDWTFSHGGTQYQLRSVSRREGVLWQSTWTSSGGF